jgi:hypothetical protein
MRRAVAIATVLLATSAVVVSQASATTTGVASPIQTVTSGTWKATPSSTAFDFASGSVPPPQYFSVTNDGDLDLVGATYTLTVSGLSVGTVSIRACTLPWNETLHVCAGVITTIVTNSNSPQSVTATDRYPALSGSSIRLQIIDTGANVSTVTATVAVSVSRAQVRTATTTNS